MQSAAVAAEPASPQPRGPQPRSPQSEPPSPTAARRSPPSEPPSSPSGARRAASKPVRFQSYISGVLRIRPAMGGETEYMKCHPKKGFALAVTEDYSYGEDSWAGVLGPACPQHDVYLTIGLPIVEAVMAGRRACLFAYGQTGSGKTFSMYGPDGGRNPAKLDGVVPAICAELFRRKIEVEKRKHDMTMEMIASLVEVRGNEIIDLLADPTEDGSQPRVKLVRSELLCVHRKAISSQHMLTGLIELGMSRRMTGVNCQHTSSSRSHAFLTVDIVKEFRGTKGTEEFKRIESTRMHLVDLAGSEKYSASDPEGLSINQSLLSLGSVIMAKARGDDHVPYRNSTLTRMLRESLEMDCTTIILGCLNPGRECMSESKNVLKFMERAAFVDRKGGKLKQAVPILYQKRVLAAAAEIAGGVDPLCGDKEDHVKYMLRRTETIMTKNLGALDARACGNPLAPLVLYFHGRVEGDEPHGKRARGTTSKMWNGIVTELAERMNELSDVEVNGPVAQFGDINSSKPMAPGDRSLGVQRVPSANSVAPLGPMLKPLNEHIAGCMASSGQQESAPKSSKSDLRASSRRLTNRRPVDGKAPKSSFVWSKGGKTSVRSQASRDVKGDVKNNRASGAEQDDRLAELRSLLFILLRSRHQELAKDVVCQLCQLPLVEPTRVPTCRHVLCEACALTSMRYFADCPICSERTLPGTIAGDVPVDSLHALLMRLRIQHFKVPALLIESQQRRAALIAREGERSERFLLEFGVHANVDVAELSALCPNSPSAPSPSEGSSKTKQQSLEAESKTPRARFAEGKAVLRTVSQPLGLLGAGGDALLQVSITGPDVTGVVQADSESGFSASLRLDTSKSAVRLRFAVTFNAVLGIAPLHINYRGPIQRYTRRIVIQMPQSKRKASIASRSGSSSTPRCTLRTARGVSSCAPKVTDASDGAGEPKQQQTRSPDSSGAQPSSPQQSPSLSAHGVTNCPPEVPGASQGDCESKQQSSTSLVAPSARPSLTPQSPLSSCSDNCVFCAPEIPDNMSEPKRPPISCRRRPSTTPRVSSPSPPRRASDGYAKRPTTSECSYLACQRPPSSPPSFRARPQSTPRATSPRHPCRDSNAVGKGPSPADVRGQGEEMKALTQTQPTSSRSGPSAGPRSNSPRFRRCPAKDILRQFTTPGCVECSLDGDFSGLEDLISVTATPPVGQPGAKPRSDAVIFECLDSRNFTANGWVIYLADYVSAPSEQPRTGALVRAAKTRETLIKDERRGGSSDVWLEQMSQQTNSIVEQALGAVADVVQILIHAAYKRWPFNEIAEHYSEVMSTRSSCGGGELPLLVQDFCSQYTFPKVEAAYAELCIFMHEDPGRVSRLLKDGRLSLESSITAFDNMRRPSSFYQLAIDLPIALELTPSVLGEIISTVGKKHAYAIVASGNSVLPVISSIISERKLASFLVFKDPNAPSIPAKIQNVMSMISQPTLLLLNGGARNLSDCTATAQVLQGALTRCALSVLTSPTGKVSEEMASRLVDFFRETSWIGSLSGDGTDADKPVVTRLSGGIDAWLGVAKPQAMRTTKEKAHKLWLRARLAFRFDTFALENFKKKST